MKTTKLLSLILAVGMLSIAASSAGSSLRTSAVSDSTAAVPIVQTTETPKLAGVTIAGNDIADYVIVKPADATESEAFAAEELSAYIEKACGVKLEIVMETDSEKTITIVRDTSGELGTDGVRICTEDGKLTIAGGTVRGCLNGVYEFLDSYIGWRFLPHGQEYLITEGTVDIPDGIDDTQIPVLEYRYSYWTPYYNAETAEPDAAKQKVNVRTYSLIYGGSFGFTAVTAIRSVIWPTVQLHNRAAVSDGRDGIPEYAGRSAEAAGGKSGREADIRIAG